MGSTMDTRILSTLRAQAWQRAKGELNSIIETYWDEGTGEESKFSRMNKAKNDFIDYIEGEGLAE